MHKPVFSSICFSSKDLSHVIVSSLCTIKKAQKTLCVLWKWNQSNETRCWCCEWTLYRSFQHVHLFTCIIFSPDFDPSFYRGKIWNKSSKLFFICLAQKKRNFHSIIYIVLDGTKGVVPNLRISANSHFHAQKHTELSSFCMFLRRGVIWIGFSIRTSSPSLL